MPQLYLPEATAAAFLCLIAAPAQAQWISYPTPDIPRTADGKPNLNAPAPRTSDGKPDLSGVWGISSGKYLMNIAADLKPTDLKPWALESVGRSLANLGRDNPGTSCLPNGPETIMNGALPKKIVQTPKLIVILEETLEYRQIFLDGRPLPKDPNPSFKGYSVGHWEGDTLVVESMGFNGRNWLDAIGHPHSEDLRLTERIRRTSFGRLEIEQTVNDPKAFEKPFNVRIDGYYLPDTDLLEYVCLENEKDKTHFTGTAAAMTPPNPVKVAPEILAKYVGTYDFRFPENPSTPQYFRIKLVDGQLVGDGMPPLVPLSETRFFGGQTIYFLLDGSGRVTHMVVSAAEGDLRMPRVSD
jgi:hypothetical protein